MKVKELMIGDWLSCNGTPIQLNVGQLYNLVCDTDWAKKHQFEFIPLTDKILEANGFVYEHPVFTLETDNHLIEIMHLAGDTFCLSMASERAIKKGKGYCFSMDFIFVHELQQMLRLCDLNELADNFKIE